MPDELVELISPTGAVPAKNAGFSGICVSSSSGLDKSDLAEERATRLAELQEQVGAEQVGSYTCMSSCYLTSLFLTLYSAGIDA